jgi:hypothetical protein
MGWIESPQYFCAASETARDVGQAYAHAPVGSLPQHPLEKYTKKNDDYKSLPATSDQDSDLFFNLEVYVDDFIGMCTAYSQCQLDHTARAVMMGIHDVFPPATCEDDDPNSVKKLKAGDGAWGHGKEVLGFDFDGEERTIILNKKRTDELMSILKQWARLAKKKKKCGAVRVPFDEFRTIINRLRHAAICVPTGRALLSECNTAAAIERKWVYFRWDSNLCRELVGWRTLLREATAKPTKCACLVSGHPDYIGIVDASTEGVGAIAVGELTAMKPTVSRLVWPQEVRDRVLCSRKNPTGDITNSDLECCGFLYLWFVMEYTCPSLKHKHFGMLDDNSPTVGWIKKMTSSKSKIAAALLRILAVRLECVEASPLTPMHIPGDENAITDIPSRSFGRKAKWHCTTDAEFLTLFDSKFPLPQQNSWTLFHLPKEITSKLISVLLTQRSEPAEWRRLPKGKPNSGSSGIAMPHLWEWTLTCRKIQPSTTQVSGLSADLQAELRLATSATAARLALQRSLKLSLPLDRRFPWTDPTIH